MKKELKIESEKINYTILVNRGLTIQINDESYLINAIRLDSISISSSLQKNIIIKEGIDTTIGKTTLRLISNGCADSKINTNLYEAASLDATNNIEQIVINETIIKIRKDQQKSSSNKKTTLYSKLFKKIFN